MHVNKKNIAKKQMKSNDKNEFLFGDITDSEMDHLFAFAKS